MAGNKSGKRSQSSGREGNRSGQTRSPIPTKARDTYPNRDFKPPSYTLVWDDPDYSIRTNETVLDTMKQERAATSDKIAERIFELLKDSRAVYLKQVPLKDWIEVVEESLPKLEGLGFIVRDRKYPNLWLMTDEYNRQYGTQYILHE